MHPLHPVHPYNNGYRTLGACCQLGATGPEPVWYKNPLWLLAGVGAFMYIMRGR